MQQHPLKAARKAQAMTLSQLSEASGVPKSTICRIERRQNVGRPATLRRLGAALDLDWWTLLEEGGDE